MVFQFNAEDLVKSGRGCKFALQMHRLMTIISIVVFAAIGLLIFYLAVTGRGETSLPVDTSAYVVRGADISAHNGNVDFDILRENGLEFVFIKATEGADFKDAAFASNRIAARKAGLKVGAYHFFRFDSPGYMQALNLLHSVRGRQLDLPLVIDVEEWTNPVNRSTDQTVGRIKEMAEELRSEGYRVMLYTNKDGYSRFVDGRLDNYPLWICSFKPLDDDTDWTMWQYTHRGTIEGIDRLIDLNVFRGDRVRWDSRTAIRRTEAAPVRLQYSAMSDVKQ